MERDRTETGAVHGGANTVMTTATKKVPGPGRGGKREGAGRKSADGVTIAGTVQVIARVTPDQRKRFLKLGGSAWLRAVIDREFGKEL